MLIVGMDTDSKGSIAILDCRKMTKPTLDIYGIPNMKKKMAKGTQRTEVNYPALVAIMVELISSVPVDKIYLEDQWARPGDGIVGAFSFGKTFGDCRSATAAGFLAAGLSPEKIESKIAYVPGGDWKSAMGLDSDKSKSITLANKLFPSCSKAWAKTSVYTSAAEASLLAVYAASIEGFRFVPGSVVSAVESPILTSAPSLVFTGADRKRSIKGKTNGKG